MRNAGERQIHRVGKYMGVCQAGVEEGVMTKHSGHSLWDDEIGVTHFCGYTKNN